MTQRIQWNMPAAAYFAGHGIVVALGCALLVSGASAADRSAQGLWQGKIMDALRIVVHVDVDSSGALSAKVDSPDQGAMDLPVSTTTFVADSLRLELEKLGAAYAGRMSTDGASITGEWRQSGQVLPLLLKRTDKVEQPRRPQDPQLPYPYAAEEVQFPGGAPGVSLAGTLTKPKGDGPFPVALLITGSGPENRDETILGHRPFLVIADDLTRSGIAVLRIDDRGVGGSTGDAVAATSEDCAADVMASVAFLAARKDIEAKRIGLIGHSEGGLIAPMVATRMPGIAFIVMLAGPGVTGAEIMLAQGATISRAMGRSDTYVAKQQAIQRKLFALAKQAPDSVTAAGRVREIFREEAVDSTTASAQLRPSIAFVRSEWFRFFLDYDPRPTLRRVTCPVLALNGSRDVQVPVGQNLAEIKKALRAGGNHDFETRELPGLNHLFQTCVTGSPAEYATIEETIAPAALQLMRDWIVARELPMGDGK